jgi:hypothetical protein
MSTVLVWLVISPDGLAVVRSMANVEMFSVFIPGMMFHRVEATSQQKYGRYTLQHVIIE